MKRFTSPFTLTGYLNEKKRQELKARMNDLLMLMICVFAGICALTFICAFIIQVLLVILS